MKPSKIALAAALLVSIASTSPAKADGISDALGLTNYFSIGQNLFVSSLTSDGLFLNKLQEVASSSTFAQIVTSFVTFGNSKGGSLSEATFTGAFAVGTNYSWSSTILFDKVAGTISFAGNTITATTGNNSSVTPVPGPEAGAGVGALAMAGMAYFAMRRRKQQLAA